MTPPPRPHPGRPWLLILGGWTLVGLIATGQFAIFTRLASEDGGGLGAMLLSTLTPWLVYALVTPVVGWIVARYPFVPGARGRAIAAHTAMALVTTLLHAAAVVESSALADPASLDGRPFLHWIARFLASRVLLELITYGAIAGAFIALDARRRLREREQTAAALAIQLAQAQLQALQGQLQPHFLFNTLNAIGVLVREDPVGAERVVSLLADLLRRALDGAARQEVALAEELEFLEHYLEIERTRFPDRLTTTIDVTADLRRLQVPSFLLQPLVENAVRHGIAPRPEGGRVRVGAHRDGAALVLDVWNDGVPLAAGRPEGIGLGATRDRLFHLYRGAAALTLEAADGGVRARVVLPAREEA